MKNENTANETLALLKPLADAEREKRARDIEIKRRLAAEALQKIESEADQTIRQLNGEIESAKEKIAQIENESKLARAELDRLSWKRYGENLRFSNEKNKHSAYLLETFDPELSRAIEFFRKKHDELMRLDTDEQVRSGRKNLLSLKQTYALYSNNDSIKAALQYCRDAIRELEKMRLDPVCSYRRIEALKSSIPDHQIMKEYSMEKPVKSADEVRIHSTANGLHDAKVAELISRNI